ncbi:MAG TPA: tagaturonate reductase [Acholeplasmatales bacterium]|nr:MAG: hypothetical protein A2Y16_02940 [Tenericutes bacterium GWF2_57_13]HAQ57363.1 tagaturonate reductase [Acholeplasmatales bacterium]
MERLNRVNHPAQLRPIRIMQFGEGNFLRAFVDNFVQILNDKGLIDANVAVVQPLPQGRIAAMAEQDGLYTLFLEGKQNGEIVKSHRIIDVVSEYIDPFADLDMFYALARSEDLQVVFSNTTEAGIVYEPVSLIDGVLPDNFPAKLLSFLKKRYDAFGGSRERGLEIVPCELIDHNGDHLHAALDQLAAYNGMEPDFIDWLDHANRYYSTLVDRIVPGYPKEDAARLEAELGYLDHSMVKGEIFHLWVIEGPARLRSLLPFDRAGLDVRFVDSIVPYKERKVKILNGAHTALVPIAYLLGHTAVRQSIEDPAVDAFVHGFVFDEVIPTIRLPKADMEAFADSVFERYANPFIHHLLLSISLNSVSKYKSRILPTVEDNLAYGNFPKHALFALAALICFYRGADANGDAIPLKDEERFLSFFREAWASCDPSAVAAKTLLHPFWESTRLASPAVTLFVSRWTETIVDAGMPAALARFLREA